MNAIELVFRREGWMMRGTTGVSCQILPPPGSTILIGRTNGAKDNKVNLTWVDSKGQLKILPLVVKPDHMEIKVGRQLFLVTIKHNGDNKIEGQVVKGRKAPFEPAGTWGADINPGGG